MDRLEKKNILINILACKDYDWFYKNICPYEIDETYHCDCFDRSCEECFDEFIARCSAVKDYEPVKF